MCLGFSKWISPAFGMALTLKPDLDQVEALNPERDALWTRLEAANFLTDDEKRAAAGYGPKPIAPKFNPNHDELGRFTFADGGSGGSGSGGLLAGAGLASAGVKKLMEMLTKTPQGQKLIQQMEKLLGTKLGQAAEKLPEFLAKKPGVGKITGDLTKLTKEEQAFAKEIQSLGHDVEIIPRGTTQTADFYITGVKYELKTVSGVEDTSLEGLSKAIKQRAFEARSQSENIIIDARNQVGMTREAAQKAINRTYGLENKEGAKIQSITILTKDGPVHSPRIVPF